MPHLKLGNTISIPAIHMLLFLKETECRPRQPSYHTLSLSCNENMVKFFSRDIFLLSSYSQVAQDDDSISTREKDINKELAWQRNSTSQAVHHRSRWLRVAVWTLGILSATTIVAIFSFYLGMSYEQTRKAIEFIPESKRPPKTKWPFHKLTLYAVGRRTVVFEEVSNFSEPPSVESDQAWDSLLPRRSFGYEKSIPCN